MCVGVTDQGNFYQQHEKDIQRFLEKEINFSRLPFSVEDVTKKCGGLFLYAFCVVKELHDPAHLGKFVAQRTSDRTVSFLHNLIPVWLSDEGKARLLFVDKKTADEYLKNIFLDILYIVVGKPPPTLSSEWIDGDLQNYILRFAIHFLCQCGDNASLEGERIKLDGFSLLYDLRLAAHRFPLEMTLERDVINTLEHIIDSTSIAVISCSPYVLKSALSVSDIVRENIWSVHQWQLERVFNSSHDYYYFLRSFAVTSDKKLIAGALSHPPRIFFPDAVTGKTVAGPFEIPTDFNIFSRRQVLIFWTT
ncbi:unnamed protein product [Porites evermanni]|uniref:Maturase K n=1 Tax=Porites evermanni TaxID=104178 RepID=A0ABN8QND3_9CNID|nr:unnamed protein product [Porites evermanni]